MLPLIQTPLDLCCRQRVELRLRETRSQRVFRSRRLNPKNRWTWSGILWTLLFSNSIPDNKVAIGDQAPGHGALIKEQDRPIALQLCQWHAVENMKKRFAEAGRYHKNERQSLHSLAWAYTKPPSLTTWMLIARLYQKLWSLKSKRTFLPVDSKGAADDSCGVDITRSLRTTSQGWDKVVIFVNYYYRGVYTSTRLHALHEVARRIFNLTTTTTTASDNWILMRYFTTRNVLKHSLDKDIYLRINP